MRLQVWPGHGYLEVIGLRVACFHTIRGLHGSGSWYTSVLWFYTVFEAKDILCSSSLWSPEILHMAWGSLQLLGIYVPSNHQTKLR